MNTPVSSNQTAPGSLNVLLVIPKYLRYGGGAYVMPMGILYVSAAARRAGLSLWTLNLNHAGADYNEVLRETISRHRIHIVGAGGLSGEYADLAPLFSFVKENFPDITTVAGGGIVTASPETALQALESVDIGIIGEGEESFPEVVRALEKGLSLDTVPGIIYKSGDAFHRTASRPDIADLDDLPFPDYEGFDYEAYLTSNSAGYGREGEVLSPVSVIGSRSCPYRCTFCFHPTGESYRTRSLEAIFQEIEYLISRYQVNNIALREELFANDRARIEAFCERMAPCNVHWSIQLRVNQVDEGIFALLKRAGCFNVFLGMESMSDSVLKSMKKGIRSQQILQVLEMAQREGVMIRSGLIFGDREETLETAEKSLQWLEENEGYQDVYRRPAIIADMIIPFPGSALYRDAVSRGVIPNPVSYLRQGCPIVNLTRLSRADFLLLMGKVQTFNKRPYFFLDGEDLEQISPP